MTVGSIGAAAQERTTDKYQQLPPSTQSATPLTKAMDSKGDAMVSRAEFNKYHEDIYNVMKYYDNLYSEMQMNDQNLVDANTGMWK